jgi:hypothetical protein
MAGYSVTFSVVDEATAQIERISQRIRQIREPIERQARAVQKFIDAAGLGKVADGFTSIARTAGAAFSSLSRIVPVLGTITGAATIAGVYELAKGFAAWGVALRTDADRIGTTAQKLETLQDMMRIAGGSADDMTASLKDLTTSAAAAFTGRDTNAAAWFNRAGIALRDANGHLRNTTELLPEVLKFLDSIKNPADRMTAAIGLGSASFANLTEEIERARRSGETFEEAYRRIADAAARRPMISQEDIDRAQRFSEATGDLTTSLGHLAHTIGSLLSDPVAALERGVTHVSDLLDRMTRAIDRWINDPKNDSFLRKAAGGAWWLSTGGPGRAILGYGYDKLFGGEKFGPPVPPEMQKIKPGAGPAALSGDHAEFLKKAWPLAQQVAAQTGLDPRVVVAQAALESGWGKKASGQNFFGVKPGGTLAQYGSMEESFQAYADLINRRYPAARAGKTPSEQISGLVAGGYTADAGYAENLNRIVNQLSPSGGTAQENLSANFAKHSGLFGPPGDAGRMVTITGPGGARFTVNKLAAPQFEAFLNDFHRAHPDYPITSGGGYNRRTIRESAEWSEHAYGTAIDINPATNPMLMGKLQTDLPGDTGDIAARHGIKWGGSFHDRPDPMHFEIARLQAEGAPAQVTGGPPVNGSVDVTVTHKNPPPGANLRVAGTGDVAVAPPRTEFQAMSGP